LEDAVKANRSEYTWAIAAIGAALVALFIAAGLSGAFGHSIPTQLLTAGGALVGGLVGIVVPAPGASRAAAGASVVHAAAAKAAAAKAAEIAAGPTATPADVTAAQGAAQEVAAVTTPTSARARTAINAAIAQHATAAAQVTQAPTGAAGAAPASSAAARVKQAAADAATADETKQDAAAAASATPLDTILDGGKVVIPGIVFVGALWIGVAMSDGSITYHNCHVYSALSQGQTEAPCATQLFQAANALITLAATTAGTIVGLFAPSPK
jgi:hypothetical protein